MSDSRLDTLPQSTDMSAEEHDHFEHPVESFLLDADEELRGLYFDAGGEG